MAEITLNAHINLLKASLAIFEAKPLPAWILRHSEAQRRGK